MFIEEINKVNTNSAEYLNHVNELSANERSVKLGEIHDFFEKAKVYSDEKVQLAMQTYEMVDKHIRRLDTELAKFEAELKEKQIANNSGGLGSIDTGKKIKTTQGQRNKIMRFNPKNVIKNDNEKGRKKQKIANPEATNTAAATTPLPMITNTNEVLDMPVDPNEPTYCLCHQVSYGEMIGCDNADCPIEWFHFGCVGLQSKPKGKWFCPKCTVERKKK